MINQDTCMFETAEEIVCAHAEAIVSALGKAGLAAEFVPRKNVTARNWMRACVVVVPPPNLFSDKKLGARCRIRLDIDRVMSRTEDGKPLARLGSFVLSNHYSGRFSAAPGVLYETARLVEKALGLPARQER